MARLEFPDGSWAELRERPTHGQVNLVRRALLRIVDDAEASTELYAAYVKAYVEDWHVVDPATGHEVPLDRPDDAPDDIVEAIATEARRLYTERKKEAEEEGDAPKGLRALSGS